MKKLTTGCMLAAVFITSACNSTTNTTKLSLNNEPQLISSLNWEQATAASSAASVSNNSLIMMR